MKDLTIYLDMDGVLANFDKAVEDMKHIYEQPWLRIPGFFRDLEVIGNPNQAIEELQSLGYKVYILTKVDISDHPFRAIDKKNWIREHIPCISEEELIIVPIDEDKKNYIRSNIENSILLDDYKENLLNWQKNGGISVKFGNKRKNSRPYLQIVGDIKNLKIVLKNIEVV